MHDAALGMSGELLFVATTSDGFPRLARSTDGGETFPQAYVVWNQMQAENPRLAVDAGLSPSHRGNVYLTAYEFEYNELTHPHGDGLIGFSRSNARGKTFSPTAAP